MREKEKDSRGGRRFKEEGNWGERGVKKGHLVGKKGRKWRGNREMRGGIARDRKRGKGVKKKGKSWKK